MVLGAFLFTVETKAQVRVGVNINIGRPSWGVPGNYTGDYYYIPEIDTYYDIPHRQFVYLQGNNWVFASSLPYAYRNYDLNRGYKVVINEPRPYLRGNMYRSRYSNYYDNYHRQNVVVRSDRFDNRRFDNDRNNNGRDDRFERRRDDRHDRNDHDRGRGNGRGRG